VELQRSCFESILVRLWLPRQNRQARAFRIVPDDIYSSGRAPALDEEWF
jgi:hypothetical protein